MAFFCGSASVVINERRASSAVCVSQKLVAIQPMRWMQNLRLLQCARAIDLIGIFPPLSPKHRLTPLDRNATFSGSRDHRAANSVVEPLGGVGVDDPSDIFVRAMIDGIMSDVIRCGTGDGGSHGSPGKIRSGAERSALSVFG